jgi:hypothetical protein
MVLLAGVEKAGKSWAAAAASGSPRVGRTLWLSIGEDDPDAYAGVPGASFEIVQPAPGYKGVVEAVQAMAAEPQGDRPTLLVVDSMSMLWDRLQVMAQDTANARQAKRRSNGRIAGNADDDAQITMDLWNEAKDRWRAVMRPLLAHTGPVVLTARIELSVLMDAQGRPTTARDWKIVGHKTLPFDCDAVVQLRARGDAWLTGVRSVIRPLTETTRLGADWSVPGLWAAFGVAYEGVRSRADAPAGPAAVAAPSTPRPSARPEAPSAPPPVESASAPAPDGLVTDHQRKWLWAACKTVGIATSEEAHQFAGDVLGHPVESISNLTRGEAGKVIAAAEQAGRIQREQQETDRSAALPTPPPLPVSDVGAESPPAPDDGLAAPGRPGEDRPG